MKKVQTISLREDLQPIWDALPTADRLMIDGEYYVYARRGKFLRPVRLTSLTQAERASLIGNRPRLNSTKTA